METVVLFDGYKQGPSTKDQKHKRRAKKACADMQLIDSMEAHVNQRPFFVMKDTKPSSFPCKVATLNLMARYLQEMLTQ